MDKKIKLKAGKSIKIMAFQELLKFVRLPY
jgi:hypothetical protein